MQFTLLQHLFLLHMKPQLYVHSEVHVYVCAGDINRSCHDCNTVRSMNMKERLKTASCLSSETLQCCKWNCI